MPVKTAGYHTGVEQKDRYFIYIATHILKNKSCILIEISLKIFPKGSIDN